MARISFLAIPEGKEHIYKKTLKAANRFVKSAIRMNSVFFTRKQKQHLLTQTRMLIAKAKWQLLNIETREAWTEAGAKTGLTGWQVFFSDINARQDLKLSLPGEPNEHYQVNVGKITIPEGSTFAHIRQDHPEHYTIKIKVPNTRSQFIPADITEDFSIPLEIGLSYKSDLTSAGANPEAVFYARVLSYYQGTDIENNFEIAIPLQSNWDTKTLLIDEVFGQVKAYSLHLEINDAEGSVYFDNVKAIHNSQNWARDKRCDNINEDFKRPFQHVIHNWRAESLDNGATFKSVYFNQG